jgi:3-dehydroquinate dehydratase/shikimate dehydrogenase
LFDRAESAATSFKFIELRLDSLSKPANAFAYLKQFLGEHKDVTVIATCRRKSHGGGFDGPLVAELEILTKAAQTGCHIIDLEVESAEEAKSAQLARLRAAGAALLISFHDFSRTKGLDQAADRIEAFKPDFVKVVSTARTLVDNLAVLRVIEDHSLATNVVGIAMGEEGLVSRVLGPRAGAAFTFASWSEGTETAPGQATAETLRDVYRLDHLDQATRVFGVAGNPIAHSLSPLLHNAAFRREIVNAVLLPLKAKSVQYLMALALELTRAGALPHARLFGVAHVRSLGGYAPEGSK